MRTFADKKCHNSGKAQTENNFRHFYFWIDYLQVFESTYIPNTNRCALYSMDSAGKYKRIACLKSYFHFWCDNKIILSCSKLPRAAR